MTKIRTCSFAVAGVLAPLLVAAQPGLEKKPGGAPPGQEKKDEKAPAGGGAMMMPKPAPELDAALKSWEGTWKCETTFPAGAMAPGSPEMKTQSTVKIKKDTSL